jgi:hypothetical protein
MDTSPLAEWMLRVLHSPASPIVWDDAYSREDVEYLAKALLELSPYERGKLFAPTESDVAQISAFLVSDNREERERFCEQVADFAMGLSGDVFCIGTVSGPGVST